MFIYIIFYLFFVVFIIFKFKGINNLYVSKVLVFTLILLSFFRYNVGTDFIQYSERLVTAPFLINFLQDASIIEFGSNFIMSLIKTLGLSIHYYFLIMTSISMLVIYKVFNKIDPDYVLIFLFLYFCLFFLSFQFNIIRHGVMASFVWLAFIHGFNRNIKKFILFILFGFLFHGLSLFFLPFYLFFNKNIKTIVLIVILVTSFVFGLLDPFNLLLNIIPSNTFFYDKLHYYIIEYYAGSINKSYGITLGTIIYLILLLILIIYRKKISQSTPFADNLLVIFVIALSLNFFFNKYAIFVERIVSVLYVSIIVILPPFFNAIAKNQITKKIFLLLILMYGTLIFYKVTHYKNKFGVNQFVPYQSFLNK